MCGGGETELADGYFGGFFALAEDVDACCEAVGRLTQQCALQIINLIGLGIVNRIHAIGHNIFDATQQRFVGDVKEFIPRSRGFIKRNSAGRDIERRVFVCFRTEII